MRFWYPKNQDQDGQRFKFGKIAIDKSVDDELALEGSIKSEGHIQFLKFSVGDDTGLHGWFLIK